MNSASFSCYFVKDDCHENEIDMDMELRMSESDDDDDGLDDDLQIEWWTRCHRSHSQGLCLCWSLDQRPRILGAWFGCWVGGRRMLVQTDGAVDLDLKGDCQSFLFMNASAWQNPPSPAWY